MGSWLSIGKGVRKHVKAGIRRRYFGISDLTFHGAVFAPDAPDARFHVGLVDPSGEILYATRADKQPLKDDVPDGCGFTLPVPHEWLAPSEIPHLFQFRIIETGDLFPNEPRELPIDRLLRAAGRRTESGIAVLARLKRLTRVIAENAGEKTLIAGTHNMTRTGAPMILLEIIKQLKERFGYGTVLLSLDPADKLTPEFDEHCVAVVDNLVQSFRTSKVETNQFLADLAQTIESPIALINSLCSTRLAEACSQAGFEVRSLIHEYPHAFDPDWARRHLAVANKIVLPCKDVRDSYLEGDLGTDASSGGEQQFSVLAQGCYMLEKQPIGDDERESFAAAFREEHGLGVDDKLVVSCGTLDSRKGFDWFASLIRHYAKASPEASTTHFLWIGGIGENQLLFHALHDLEKEGLITRFHHLDEVEDVRLALGLADVFLLCSRIDPFPSVVLESFLMGMPVIGFDTGQGSREMIRETGFGSVVPYLDSAATVRAIDELLGDSWKTQRVREHGPEFVAGRFRYSDYVDRLAGWMFDGHDLGDNLSEETDFPVRRPTPDQLPPVLLLGFHRSGTSYLSRFLDSIGVNMMPSGRYLEGGAGNPEGHFEDLAVLDHHCSLLQQRHPAFVDRWGGKRCIFLPSYNDDWDEFVPETRALVDHIAKDEPWGWKDPRSLLFLGLWQKAVGRSFKIYALRHPLEIFLSLIRRACDSYFFTRPLAFFEAYEGYHRDAVTDFRSNPDDWFVMQMPPDATSLGSLHTFLSAQLGIDLKQAEEGAQFDHAQFHSLEIPTEIADGFRQHFPRAAAIHDLFSGQAPPASGEDEGTQEQQFAWLAGAYKALLGDEADLYKELQQGLLRFGSHSTL